MVRADIVAAVLRRQIAIGLCWGIMLLASTTFAQPLGPPAAGPTPSLAGQQIVDVRIQGNRAVSIPQIRAELRTRVGQPFDQSTVISDVRSLTQTGKIFDVKVRTQPGPQPSTIIVIFQVFEYPKVEYIHFLGNGIRDKSLLDAIALKVGDPLDVVSVESARDTIVDFYKERGFNKAKVEIREGTKPSDRGVAFIVSDGPQQQVWNVKFVGNKIVSGGRLKTQIESKPSLFKYTFFGKGYVNLKKIDADVEKIESYYRDLGFMLARVGRELTYNKDETKLDITFVIDEGPRFTVRDVVIRGSHVFSPQQLESLIELKKGEVYSGPDMRQDVAKLTEIYGAVGYVMADVKPSPRTLQHAPQVDLIYEIEEGKRYRVGKINVNIGGDDPHTKLAVALNRISLQPGDIIDIRKIRESERRLRSSGLFAVEPLRGIKPQIVFSPREGQDGSGIAKNKKKRGTAVRGQSPDGSARPWFEIEMIPTAPLPSYYDRSPQDPVWRTR